MLAILRGHWNYSLLGQTALELNLEPVTYNARPSPLQSMASARLGSREHAWL